MAKRVTDEQRERMQEVARVRWNRMVEREAARQAKNGTPKTDLASIAAMREGRS